MLRVRDGADQITQVVHGTPVDRVLAGSAIQQGGGDGQTDQIAHGDADRGAFGPVLPHDTGQPVRVRGHADVVHVLQWGEDVGQMPQVGEVVARPLGRPLRFQVVGFRGSVARKHEARLLQFGETIRFGQFLEHRVQRHGTARLPAVRGEDPFLHVRGQHGRGLPLVRIPQVAGSLERRADHFDALAFDGLRPVLDMPVQAEHSQRAAGRERRIRPTVRAILQPGMPVQPDPRP